MRICTDCEKEKPDSDFYIYKKDGRDYVRGKCRRCFLDQNRRNEKKKKVLFFEFKKTLSCNRCGFSDFRALQFHHLGDKKFNISDMIGKLSVQSLMEEINKCEVLCGNCHLIETHEERKNPSMD